MAEGPAFLQFLGDTHVHYFLDLKFHDIPATITGAASRMLQGAKPTTVHVDQGRKSLKASVAAMKSGVKVLGVTVLTHLGPDDLEAMGIAPEYARDPAKLVLLRAKLAHEAGCDGVVWRRHRGQGGQGGLGPDFLVVCPAIRPAWAAVPGMTRATSPRLMKPSGPGPIISWWDVLSAWLQLRLRRPAGLWRKLPGGWQTGDNEAKKSQRAGFPRPFIWPQRLKMSPRLT